MTKLLYHQDSYLKEFSAKVVSFNQKKHSVLLDQTAFYPGGGGQPTDTGHLIFNNEQIPVIRAKNVRGEIIHLLDQEKNLPEKHQPVRGKINWDTRYQLMRTHTAMHILCGVIFRDYGVSVTGGNMAPLQGRMDFEFTSMTKELASYIEQAVNQEVEKGRPVQWRVLPREEAFQIPDLIRTKINLLPDYIQKVRVVEIKGLDLQADGGTHVRNTSEVGCIQITDYKSKGAENKRIYLELID